MFSLRLAVCCLLVMMLAWNIMEGLGDFSVRVEDDAVNVRIQEDMRQGVPSRRANVTDVFTEDIPKVSFVLSGSNASGLEESLSASIRSGSSKTNLRNVYFAVSSNGSWISIDFSFQIVGVISGTEDLRTIDLSWRSFVVSDDLRLGNFSFNRVGEAYLAEPVGFLLGESNLPVAATRQWFLNGRSRSATLIPNDVRGLSLFNFTSLSKSLDSWERKVDIESATTRLSMRGGFNLTFLGTIREPEEIFVQAFTAVFTPQVVIEVAGIATGDGDFLRVDTGRGFPPEAAMLTGIVTVSMIGIGTYAYERRLRKTAHRVRDKKRK